MKTLKNLALAAAFAAASTSSALAGCAGTDLRETLSADEKTAFEQVIAAVPYATGNHWVARKQDKTIHLIGTIHLDDPRLDAITERLASVVESSDMLLLEMTPAEEEALKKDMGTRPELLFLQGQSLPELMSEENWQLLASEMTARNIPPVLASRFQPWYLSVLLAMPPCLSNELMGATPNGLDHRLMRVAEDAGVALKALEPHDTLFTLFTDEPLEEQIDVMLLGLQTADQSVDALQTIANAYYEENHAEAWEMSRRIMMQIEGTSQERLEELFAEMEDDLLVARNAAWIPVILNALDTRAQITVAAGAGHWSGKAGVLALLEAEGFTLERLPF